MIVRIVKNTQYAIMLYHIETKTLKNTFGKKVIHSVTAVLSQNGCRKPKVLKISVNFHGLEHGYRWQLSHKLLCRCVHFAHIDQWKFLKFIKYQRQESLIYKAPCPFGSKYKKSYWVSLFKLWTSGLVWFNPLKLSNSFSRGDLTKNHH